MDKDEFYIGWQDQPATSFGRSRRKFFVVSLLIILLFGSGYLFVENKFVDSYFDYGNLTILKGTIVEYPVFGIRTEIDGKEVTVPLVGFGKFDALPVLEALKKQAHNVPLGNLDITLEGTLIQYKEKTWMELTEGDKSIIAMEQSEVNFSQIIENHGVQTIAGEIIDPKCFFGVMNPGYNKIHRSCAIRCISGGIPPVLATRKNGVFTDYYFVTDQMGQPLNKSILQYVGLAVNLSGQVEQVDDWKLIKVNPTAITTAFAVRLDDRMALCTPH